MTPTITFGSFSLDFRKSPHLKTKSEGFKLESLVRIVRGGSIKKKRRINEGTTIRRAGGEKMTSAS